MSVFKKLNLKDQREIVVLDPPTSFEPELEALQGVAVHRDPQDREQVEFALAFVTTLKAIETAVRELAPKLKGDAILWFAYPKASSKRYRCEFNRDTGWDTVGEAGFEPVRQVAIDDDWSAVRFRRVEFIKKLTRDPSRAMTSEGRSRSRGS